MKPLPRYTGLSPAMRQQAQLRARGYRVVDDAERPGWVWVIGKLGATPYPSLELAWRAAVDLTQLR